MQNTTINKLTRYIIYSICDGAGIKINDHQSMESAILHYLIESGLTEDEMLKILDNPLKAEIKLTPEI